MTKTVDYLYLVLMPVAEVFRSRFDKKPAMAAIKTARSCRVKFAGERLEREWQAFCKEHDLKNDTSLEY